MTLKEMKRKVLVLIEEAKPGTTHDTEDPDIQAKLHDVIDQVMFRLARMKKLPKYLELPVTAGQLVTFGDIEAAVGYEVYQLGLVSGVRHSFKANGTVIKVQEDGTAEIDCYVYPERITPDTQDSYEFELPPDVLEVMPYGVAGDLLKSDISTEYGSIYSTQFESLLQQLDPRYQLPSISIEGGWSI